MKCGAEDDVAGLSRCRGGIAAAYLAEQMPEV